jgi:ferredoxin/flavodoxin
MDTKIFIAYCSPAGSTRAVAEAIQAGFNRRKTDVLMLDLAQPQDRPAFLEALANAGSRACLFIGSPVYRDAAVPPVMRFVEALPQTDGAFAVPFVTWGAACSGLALWQLGDALIKKGFQVAGAAKVAALHSMMWRVDDPAGKGHPDEDDRRQIEQLVDTLYSRLDSDHTPQIDLGVLDYQPREQAEEIRKKIAAPWQIIPKQVNQEACTQCGVCQQECPVAAVVLDPFPEFKPNCFDCFNCIRLCPENAIAPSKDMTQIENYIRERVRKIAERPLTRIFT